MAQAVSLPQTLAASFDAFEAIRAAARDCQDQLPGLFAAFMTTADAAVDGREALTIAPSLPLDGDTEPGMAVPTGADAGQAAGCGGLAGQHAQADREKAQDCPAISSPRRDSPTVREPASVRGAHEP